MIYLLVLILLLTTLLYFIKKAKRIPTLPPVSDENYKDILLKEVPYYAALPATEKTVFEKRVLLFLREKKITGVDVEADEQTKILVAASAVIPAFAFEGYNYPMIREVLLYRSHFDNSFLNPQHGIQKGISGMVGEGPLHQVVMLSKPDLLAGFRSNGFPHNVGIHEFTHLLDKTDGIVDGIPKNLLEGSFVQSWIKAMHEELLEIQKGESDLSPYALTSPAEFFAVASEYFFVAPGLFKQRHPELLDYLQKMFRQRLDGDGLKPE